MRVIVPMVQVRVMRMAMHQRTMLVPMGVRFAGRDAGGVLVLVMLVVAVTMLVRQHRMRMLVIVPFGQVQPQSQAH